MEPFFLESGLLSLKYESSVGPVCEKNRTFHVKSNMTPLSPRFLSHPLNPAALDMAETCSKTCSHIKVSKRSHKCAQHESYLRFSSKEDIRIQIRASRQETQVLKTSCMTPTRHGHATSAMEKAQCAPFQKVGIWC
jgi:hypothetical protein